MGKKIEGWHSTGRAAGERLGGFWVPIKNLGGKPEGREGLWAGGREYREIGQRYDGVRVKTRGGTTTDSATITFNILGPEDISGLWVPALPPKHRT